MKSYRTIEGDMLDAICRAQLGSEQYTAQVLTANPGLADLGVVYPAGIIIRLPDVATVTAPTTIRMWGKV